MRYNTALVAAALMGMHMVPMTEADRDLVAKREADRTPSPPTDPIRETRQMRRARERRLAKGKPA